MKKLILSFFVMTLVPSFAFAQNIPNAPSNIKLVAPGYDTQAAGTSTTMYASWLDNANNESGFVVTVYRYAAGVLNPVATSIVQPNATITMMLDVPLSQTNQTADAFYASIYAYNQYGSSTLATSTYINAVKAPVTPINFTGIATSSRALLAWKDKATNELGYVLNRYLFSSTFMVLDTVITLPQNSTSYFDTSVVAGRLYRYTLGVFNAYSSSTAPNYVDITP